jgi:hypothetical protein
MASIFADGVSKRSRKGLPRGENRSFGELALGREEDRTEARTRTSKSRPNV